VAGAGVRPADLVLDVGAGHGVITAALVAAGARVVAIELHPARACFLRERFAAVPGVRIVQADAADLRLPRQPFRVVANPPFAITTALLRRLLSPGSRLDAAQLMVPAHVAARWSGGRGPHAGDWDIRIAARLPRTAFTPPAPGPVAVLAVRRGAGSTAGAPAGRPTGGPSGTAGRAPAPAAGSRR
jgi:23S rRNA (adenine-N6)-dimethyltransferase